MSNADHFGPWRRRLAVVSVAAAMTLGMGTIPLAVGAPSAKSDRIAQLESAIARNRVKVDAAQLHYAQTAEDFAEATDALNAATSEASESAKKAQSAKRDADAAKAKLGRLAVAMYRQNGNGLSDFAAITESDAFRKAALKEAATDALGNQADSQTQGLMALQNVAEVLRDKADRAAKAKKDAAVSLATTEKTARNQAQDALDDLKKLETQREKIIVELARERDVTIAEEKARQEKVEQERQAALAAAAQRKRQEQEALAAQQAAARAAQQAAEQKAREQAAIAEADRQARQRAAAPAAPAAPATQPSNPAPPPVAAPPQPAPPSPAAAPAPRVVSPPSRAASGGYGPALLEWAKTKTGLPYVWGGTGPNGYDCSGLVYAGMRELGKGVQRSAAAQYNAYANVPFSQKQPGDLVFWSNNGAGSGVYHVAIYSGGNTILMAPKPGSSVGTFNFYNQNRIMPFVARL